MDESEPELNDSISKSNTATSSLPDLSDVSVSYPGCCLALSAPLLSHLVSVLPPSPALILSIGSGYGLLEAILLSNHVNIIGVEVFPSPNRYLPHANHRSVHGSRSLHSLASNAKTWLFVYPRRAGLLKDYMQAFANDSVQLILWIGPRVDWDDYMGCFGKEWNITVQSADQVGGRTWDLIAIAKKLKRVVG